MIIDEGFLSNAKKISAEYPRVVRRTLYIYDIQFRIRQQEESRRIQSYEGYDGQV